MAKEIVVKINENVINVLEKRVVNIDAYEYYVYAQYFTNPNQIHIVVENAFKEAGFQPRLRYCSVLLQPNNRATWPFFHIENTHFAIDAWGGFQNAQEDQDKIMTMLEELFLS